MTVDGWSRSAELRGRLPQTARLVERAATLIDNMLHGRDGFVLWSGGKDSTAVAAVANLVRPGVPLVFIDGGMDYPGHVEWMREEAARHGWTMVTIPTDPPILDLLESTGWWDMAAVDDDGQDRFHEVANLAPSRQAIARFGPVMFSGLRADESGRRAAGFARWGSVRPLGGAVAVSPIQRWSIDEVWAVHARLGVGRSPVYDRLEVLGCDPKGQRVGHMVTSDALGYGRFMWLRRGWPETFDALAERLPRIREHS